MKKLILIIIIFSSSISIAQVESSQTGAWYMYFYNTKFNNSNWGIQGDFQYRDWQGLGDMEQLLLRSGITYSPDNSNITFTEDMLILPQGNLASLTIQVVKTESIKKPYYLKN